MDLSPMTVSHIHKWKSRQILEKEGLNILYHIDLRNNITHAPDNCNVYRYKYFKYKHTILYYYLLVIYSKYNKTFM